MKRNFFSRGYQLPIALTVLGVVGASCGLRETRSNSATSLVGKIQKASDAGAVTATPKVAVQLDDIRKQLRDATQFWKLSLAQESKERKEADESIRADVVALSAKLDALRNRLDSEISRLDKTLREEFDGKLKDQESRLVSKIDAEKAARENALKIVDANLRLAQSDLESKISGLDAKTQASIRATNQALLDSEAKVTKLLGETKASLLTDLKALEERSSKTTSDLKAELTNVINQNDANYQAKFTELQSQLKLAKSSLESQLASNTADLNAQILAGNQELAGKLKVSNAALTERISFLDLVTQKQLTEVKGDLETKIINNGSELSNLISLARAEAQKNLTKELGEQHRTLIAVMTSADNALRSELSQQMKSESASQAAALQSFKKEVDATYAKQVDLIALQGVVNGLSNAINILDHKVDENDKRLNEQLVSQRKELVDKIGNVQASVDSLKGDFANHVTEYRSKTAELARQTRVAAAKLRRDMNTMAVHNEAARTMLQRSINDLSERLTNQEDFAIKTRDALTGKINELERRDNELDNDIRQAREEATSSLSSAIAEEQKARQGIADELKVLQAEVQRVSETANQALALSQANSSAIAGLKSDLAEAQQRWDSQLKALRGDMESQIGELRQQSQLLMRGLGLDAQTHFAETTTQLADLKNKVAGLLSEMGRSLQKGINLSSDPVVKNSSAERVAAFNKKVSQDKSQMVAGTSVTLQDLASQRMDEFSKVMARLENEFLLAIDYAEVLGDEQKTQDLRAMNASFIEQVVNLKNSAGTSVCQGGNPGLVENGIPHLMASVNNEEFWAHLARAYSHMLLSGGRSGDSEFDKIFHGSAPLTDGVSLQSALALASSPSLAAGAGGECISRVNDWAKSVLFGSSPYSTRIRTALAARQGLKKVLTEGTLEVAYRALAAPAASIDALAKEALKPAFNNDEAKVIAYLRSGNVSTKDPGFYAAAGQILNEYAITRAQQIATEQNLNNFLDIAKDANTNATTKVVDAAIQSSINALKDKLDKIDKIDERVNRLAQGQATSFGLIAAMAARMGYNDLVDKAKSEVAKLSDLATPDPSLLLPLGCKATSHFFNYAEEGQPLQRCDSGVSTGDGNYGDNGKCRTTQTNTTTVNTNINTNYNTQYNYTQYQTYGSVRMVNTRGCQYGRGCYDNWYYMGSSTVYSGASTTTSTSVSTSTSSSTTYNQAIVGVLSVPWLSPLDATARAIMQRAPGSPFPSDRKTMIGLRIFGNAGKWRIEDPESGRRIEVNASDYKVADTKDGLVYELPASMFLAKTNGQAGFTESARITALTSDGSVAIANNAPAKTCLHSMNGGTTSVTRNTTSYSTSSSSNVSYTYGGSRNLVGAYGTGYYTSPLVLDLKPNRKLETVAPNMSNAMFDLQGTGLKHKVGWIAKDTGLLALDLNGNGKIDNGRELFGDFTKLKSGGLASNGYEALAEYDTNKDGVIDTKDKVFSKLVVWVDGNGDGITQKGELKSLKKIGITAIGVKYEQAAADERIQHRESVKKNLVLYKARYFGSHCPENGCRSYDVYFGYDDLIKPVAAK